MTRSAAPKTSTSTGKTDGLIKYFCLSGLYLSAFLLTLCSVRLESGNSIEEKLLKNGTKDLIREVAAQGMDYTLAFLTQVNTHAVTVAFDIEGLFQNLASYEGAFQ